MKSKTQIALRSLNFSIDRDLSKKLSALYLKAFEEYIDGNYSDSGDTLMCSIHQNFKNGHNCVGCNLDTYSNLLFQYLGEYKNFYDIHLTSTNLHLLLYLIVERYNEYFKIINLQESYRLRYFSVFQKITQWANFLKHPKAFMLTHHSLYFIEGLKYGQQQINDAKKQNKIINDEFIKEYYSGKENNSKLLKTLSKQDGFVVMFPNPVELIKDFVVAQKKFVAMIQENEIIREILDDTATIKKHFTETSEKSE